MTPLLKDVQLGQESYDQYWALLRKCLNLCKGESTELAGAEPLSMNELYINVVSLKNIIGKKAIRTKTMESLFSLVSQMLKLLQAEQRK